MQTFIPRNISGGFFNMNIQIGPFTMSMVQMFILAIGLVVAGSIVKTLSPTYGYGIAITIAAFPFMIFIGVAFFKFSELTLVPFIAKMIRTYVFDETKKYQVNYRKIDSYSIAITKTKKEYGDQQKVVENKKLEINKDNVKKLNKLLD